MNNTELSNLVLNMKNSIDNLISHHSKLISNTSFKSNNIISYDNINENKLRLLEDEITDIKHKLNETNNESNNISIYNINEINDEIANIKNLISNNNDVSMINNSMQINEDMENDITVLKNNNNDLKKHIYECNKSFSEQIGKLKYQIETLETIITTNSHEQDNKELIKIVKKLIQENNNELINKLIDNKKETIKLNENYVIESNKINSDKIIGIYENVFDINTEIEKIHKLYNPDEIKNKLDNEVSTLKEAMKNINKLFNYDTEDIKIIKQDMIKIKDIIKQLANKLKVDNK